MSTIEPSTEPRLQPYIAVDDAAAAILLYSELFVMKESYRLPMQDGRVGHAELELDGVRLLLSDEFPEMGVKGPKSLGGTSVSLLLYVDDVDAVAKRAVDAGCELESAPKDEFFGDRAAKIVDPFGHRWFVHQRLETLTPDEIKARFERMMSGG